MGKKSKKKSRGKGGEKPNGHRNSSETNVPVSHLPSTGAKQYPPVYRKVQQYKERTQAFKNGLQNICGHEFFQKDTVKSFGKAVDFLCQEARNVSNNKDVLADLIPPLRDAIRGRIEVSTMYNQDHFAFEKHQFFIDHLREQHVKLEKMASPICRSFPKPNSVDYGDAIVVAGTFSALTESIPLGATHPQIQENHTDASAFSRPSLLHCIKEIQYLNGKKWDHDTLEFLLIMAVLLGDNSLVVWLLQLSKESSTGRLMLDTMRRASFKGDIQIIESLIQLGCPVDGPAYNRETPILFAAVANHVAVVKYLVQQHRVNVNNLCWIDMLDSGHSQDRRPLLHYVVNETKPLRMVEYLIECGADLNARCVSTKLTALHYAACGPNIDVVRALLKNGADPNARSAITDETPLHTAAMWGRTETVKSLLEHGADVHCQNRIKKMPIHVACEDGHIDVIKVLVSYGCDIDALDKNHRTPLLHAINYEQEQLARALIQMGANVNASDLNHDTALSIAIISGDIGLARFLIKMGADVTAANDVGPVLHKVLRQKEYELVELLLERGADASAQESDGETPLHTLCRYPDSPESVMTLLLGYGADINAKMENGATPLHWAFAHRNPILAGALLSHGADLLIEDANGHTPLFVALVERVWELDSCPLHLSNYANDVVGKQDLPRLHNLLATYPKYNTRELMVLALLARNSQMVGLLLDKGFPKETPVTPNDDTALLLAVTRGDIDSARLLLERGADIECKDKDGFRCLHVASQDSEWDMALLLIKYRASVNVFTNVGMSPLQLHLRGLKKSPSFPFVRLLVENGADINVSNSPVLTPLHSGAYRGHAEIVTYLLRNGADVERRSYEGYTALFYACEQGHLEVAKVLVGRGADMNVRLPSGRTMLTQACLQGHKDIVRLLLRCGVMFDPNAFRAALMVQNHTIFECLKEHTDEKRDAGLSPTFSKPRLTRQQEINPIPTRLCTRVRDSAFKATTSPENKELAASKPTTSQKKYAEEQGSKSVLTHRNYTEENDKSEMGMFFFTVFFCAAAFLASMIFK